RKTDFAALYNDFRLGQPKNVPWAGSYFAFANDGIAVDLSGESPAAKYDKLFTPRQSAVKWEKENHSCSQYKGEEKKSCEGWWGHCNAWSAAGIKEVEPRKAVKYRGTTLDVADQKAWLTEMWMDSGSLFSGTTNKAEKTGTWILDSNSATARERLDGGSGTNFEAFWDVTPKTFFLLFTNYVGVLQQGVVIDRFTGDEVWNQPIVGYRILPIRTTDVLPEETNEAGLTVYPVKLRMKIYWANDGVEEGRVSKPFDINRTNDTQDLENFGDDYDARYLAFKLFFDKPLQLDGAKIVKAGRIVGDGIWDHQENPPRNAKALDQSHPDFIWAPLELDQSSHESGNPAINADNVRAALDGSSSGPVGPNAQTTKEVEVSLLLSDFGAGADRHAVQENLAFVFSRENIRTRILMSEMTVSDTSVKVKIHFGDGVSADRVQALLAEAGFKTL
ncbi:MAG: hypothetical protein ABIR96_06340, partial [Bdellovibrionota bacterium]